MTLSQLVAIPSVRLLNILFIMMNILLINYILTLNSKVTRTLSNLLTGYFFSFYLCHFYWRHCTYYTIIIL